MLLDPVVLVVSKVIWLLALLIVLMELEVLVVPAVVRVLVVSDISSSGAKSGILSCMVSWYGSS